jgi:magnesium-transporting ATPase (P-type)
MQEQPRGIKERLFNTKVFLRSLYIGAIIATGAMVGCLMAWQAGGWHFGMNEEDLRTFVASVAYSKGTTMTFAGIVIAQVGNVLASRTNKASIFKTSFASNKWIWFGIASQISIISAIVYIPILERFFGTTGLGPYDWAFLALFAGIVVLAEEIRKFVARRLAK